MDDDDNSTWVPLKVRRQQKRDAAQSLVAAQSQAKRQRSLAAEPTEPTGGAGSSLAGCSGSDSFGWHFFVPFSPFQYGCSGEQRY